MQKGSENEEQEMWFTSMRNQKGEVMMGVMAVMMAVMMLFGGMHMRHGEHRSEGDRRQAEQKHDHEKDGSQHMHEHGEGQDPVPGQDGPGN